MTSVSKYNETSQNNDDPNNAISHDCELEAKENGVVKKISVEIHDGHYFIRMLENEIFKFEELICDFEEDFDICISLSNTSSDGNTTSVSIPEDVRDSILAAVGKVRYHSLNN